MFAAMARKKKARASNKPETKETPPVAEAEAVEEGAPGKARRRAPRDIRPWVYAGFDFLIALVWGYLQAAVIPNRHGWASAMMWGLAVAPAIAGVAMLMRRRWGWRAAAAACAGLLALWIVVLVIILISAAYLAGVYGSFGKTAAMGTLVMALLSFQVVALVPALQLKFLLTRAGRRHFRLDPLWR